MGAKIRLAGLDAVTGGELGRVMREMEIKYGGIGKQKREQPEEVQLRKIELANQKRERKLLKKQKELK